MTKRTDPTRLREAAEAQLARLRGPLWAGEGAADADDRVPGRYPVEESLSEALPAALPAVSAGTRPERVARAARQARAAPEPGTRKRRPGRPSFETPRLAARELRIPTVVDDRAREVAAWAGLEPTDALWLLASLGWESWRAGWGVAGAASP
jgi:hypothetical protein